ncbi:MAG: glycoside hydrolase family 2 protein [Paludibacteraceae bacterium]|nr:glycoside hydrolase family 2 protein [Paludibacteraceae bacterium]
MKKNLLTLLLLCATAAAWAYQHFPVDGTWTLKRLSTGETKNVSLPHTWNAQDGQDGGGNYVRDVFVYSKQVVVPATFEGKTVYLKVGAANTQAILRVNGERVGEHVGGYSAFMFELTDILRYGAGNTIELEVSNKEDILCPPLSADFTFYGGISRPVEWVVCEKLHLNPNPRVNNQWIPNQRIAQPAVRVLQNSVSAGKAELEYRAQLRNASKEAQDVRLVVRIKAADGKEVWSLDESVRLQAWEETEWSYPLTLEQPHLWNGKADPYLYAVETELYDSHDKLLDSSREPLGLRSIEVDPEKGFFLNGVSYPLYGICLHEEKKDHGRAVSDADRKEAIDLLRETGLNYFRLSHYQHGDYTYAYLDTLGIACWAEIPAVNSVGLNESQNKAYRRNAVSAMIELVRQQYNHPSIICWGLSNEINYKPGIDPTETVRELNELVKSEDTHRLTTVAAMFPERQTNHISDVFSCNRYDGWYYDTIEHFGTEMDRLHGLFPNRPMGTSEYGVGANIHQHEYPAMKPAEGGQYHPEEYQSLFHEAYWKMMLERPFLWSTSVWAGFDFASDGRNEGSQPGINDKGLITFDRSVRKDAFYWYKANWNKDERFVYLTSRRYCERPAGLQTLKIYSNGSRAELFVNGKSQGVQPVAECQAFWQVKLKKGKNRIRVVDADTPSVQDEIVLTGK